VIGGFGYRGEEFAELATDTYVATDYCSATARGSPRRRFTPVRIPSHEATDDRRVEFGMGHICLAQFLGGLDPIGVLVEDDAT
jgi:hypothetical protein